MKRNVSLLVVAFLLVAAFLSTFGVKAQTITGTFPLLAGQKIRLEGFFVALIPI